MKDSEPNTIIALGLAFLCLCLGIGGCSYLMSKGDLAEAQAEQIEQQNKANK